MKPALPLAAAGLVLAASVAFAQPSQAPAGRNLQVLPREMPQRELMNVMQGFTGELGVQCSHCHVPGNFASDANPRKEITRGMMRMTWTINNQTLPAIEGLGETRVSCATCHRGGAVPALAPRPTPPGALPKQ